MSDTRDEAEQEMVSAGIASGMEDELGSSLPSSFSLPKSEKKHTKPAAETRAEESENPETSAESSEPVPGMDEWKDTYESYLSTWQAESTEARAKAEATRKRIEDEQAAALKSEADKIKAEKTAAEEKKRQEENRKKLEAELASEGARKKKGTSASEDREKKVKEAWELVRGGGQAKEGEEVVTDARGTMPQDVASGHANAPGQTREPTAYDPTTSTEPLPPSMQESTPASPLPVPTESATLSRHSATTSAWANVSGSGGPFSSGEDSPRESGSGMSSGEMIDIPPASTSQAGQATTDATPHGISSGPDNSSAGPSGGQNNDGPPTQPPSLTLSVFTMPSHLTFSRVVAVLGINLVLPFINGVMLGFGEIFAREVVRVGQIWYRDSGIFGWRRSPRGSTGGRGTTGVGLSGNGGF
ncbi:hypothetical protein BCR39DRAFT_252725 [Naematelia encephala]|uniref:Outer membrane protein TOM13-domain-containing protein n=1 Tax=Naematelia encephala TaxID=71784 RepID=A0A1Y2AVW3_9TREE|nr:hypothetical protein BCR39DRAFT_252725 [Naematelia encephala]